MPETTPAAAPLDPSVVGTTFMRQYYQLLAKEPQSLHRFYKDESRWCHGQGSQMEAPIAGQRAINEQILKRGYAGARVDLDLGSIDCQESLDHGVVVLVTGVMTLLGSPQPKPFVQTFFLAVQPKGYFVLNDCLRFLELPGAAAPAVATDKPKAAPAMKEDKKAETPAKAPASPVKKPQPAPVASPVKAAASSPVKNDALTSPAKKAQTPVKKADKAAPQKLPETKAAEPAITPPVASPKKKAPASPAKEKPATASASAPASAPAAAAPAAAAPAPAEPAPPKTWAALFSSKIAAAPAAAAAAAAAPAPAAAAPASAPVVPAASAAPTEAKTASPSKAGEPSKERPRYFSLFIRDVPAQAKENDLRELFKGFGTVAGVNIVTARGYAFVDFVEQEAMRAALADSREFKLFDKTLQVDERSERKGGPLFAAWEGRTVDIFSLLLLLTIRGPARWLSLGLARRPRRSRRLRCARQRRTLGRAQGPRGRQGQEAGEQHRRPRRPWRPAREGRAARRPGRRPQRPRRVNHSVRGMEYD